MVVLASHYGYFNLRTGKVLRCVISYINRIATTGKRKQQSHAKMNPSSDSLKRCPRRASILLIGNTGAGKSATINHLLDTGKGSVVAETGSSDPETKVTSEFVLTTNDHNNEDSDQPFVIIDTPNDHSKEDSDPSLVIDTSGKGNVVAKTDSSEPETSATSETGKGNVVAKTDSSEPETSATSESVLTSNDHNNEDSALTLGIIDTPGLNDPRGKKQDDCNENCIQDFFKTHDLYSKTKCYPNLIFLLVSANDHRIEGNNSDLANALLVLKKLDVVDQHHPNIVAVLTFCCSVSHKNVQRWEAKMREKKEIISRHIHRTLGIQAPVVLLENNYDDYELARGRGFTLLPNSEKQPENLYNACQKVLKDNEDHHGLSTFNACLANPKAEKQYTVANHKVMATDANDQSCDGATSGSNTKLPEHSNGGWSMWFYSWLMWFCNWFW